LIYRVIKFQILITLTIAGLLSACAEQKLAGTAITNVTVIDGINGVRKNQTVIFEDDKIIAVQAADLATPVSKYLDGNEKFLIPGLWDFHVHLTYDEAFTDSMPALFLYYGITSVRDTGGLMQKMLPLVKKLRSKTAISPRVFFSGPLLDGKTVVYDGESRPAIGSKNATQEEAKLKIAKLKKQGVDFIKIYEMVSPAVFSAMVDAAAEHALPTAAHVPLSLRARTAGSSVNSMEHLRNIELDCAANVEELHRERLLLLKNPNKLPGAQLRVALHKLQRIPAIKNYDEKICNQTLNALRSTVQIPTLRLNSFILSPPYERSDWLKAMGKLPEGIRSQWEKVIEELEDNSIHADATFAEWSFFLTELLHRQGVPIAAGTDTPIGLAVPGYSLHSELELLVRAGLSPLDAIRSATLEPARYFSLVDKMGSIDIGKKADLVLLDANPLEDIANTRQISAVISRGVILLPEDLSELVKTSKNARH